MAQRRPIWHHTYRARAEREGWRILPDQFAKGTRIGTLNIYTMWGDTRRKQIFANAEDARAWVETQAEAGSVFHQRALAYLAYLIITG
jgi:hypothetical protein